VTTEETPPVTDTASTAPHQAALAQEFKRLFNASELSLRDLASRVNYSPSSLSKISRGKAVPTRKVAHIIADRLGGDVAEMTRLWLAADAARRATGGELLFDRDAEGKEHPRDVATALQAECTGRGLTLAQDIYDHNNTTTTSTMPTATSGTPLPVGALLGTITAGNNAYDTQISIFEQPTATSRVAAYLDKVTRCNCSVRS